jgi:hypothetical protein
MQNSETIAWYEGVNWQNVIDRIAEGMGTTGEYLWTVLVEGTFINGVSTLIELIVFAVVGVLLGRWGYKIIKNMPWGDDTVMRPEDFVAKLLVAGCLPILVAFFLICTVMAGLKDCLMQMGAPEYEALRFLIDAAK